MSGASVLQHERLTELLVQRASEGLSAVERAELERLLAEKQYVDVDLFDQAAAALQLSTRMDDEPLPEHLRSRLLEEAARRGDVAYDHERLRPGVRHRSPVYAARARLQTG